MAHSINIRILSKEEIPSIIPLIQLLGKNNVSKKVLRTRFMEMCEQSYECAGIYEGETLIGCCGLWFQTRHYAGRSIEMDHVIIKDTHRNQGIGKQLMQYVYDYATAKQCLWVELNTYVDNFPSHKFYYNQGFVAKGYHFVKEL